jgi:hypothetical protein
MIVIARLRDFKFYISYFNFSIFQFFNFSIFQKFQFFEFFKSYTPLAQALGLSLRGHIEILHVNSATEKRGLSKGVFSIYGKFPKVIDSKDIPFIQKGDVSKSLQPDINASFRLFSPRAPRYPEGSRCQWMGVGVRLAPLQANCSCSKHFP